MIISSRDSVRGRSGLTVVELLVVLSILAVLAALLLPAVQQAREAARRCQCQDYLRQWGIGIHLYEGQRGAFPPGVRWSSPSSSFVPLVLPYVEQDSIKYDTTLEWHDYRNQPAAQVPIRILICPSSTGSARVDASRGYLGAIGDYTAIHGVTSNYCDVAGWPPLSRPLGILSGQPCPAADVTDGLSQTLLLVEDAGRPMLWRMGVAAAGHSPNAAWADPEYGIALSGSDHFTTGSGQGGGTCVMNCTNDNETYSFHPGGAELLFGDGAVRFVAQDVAPRVFAAMITRCAEDNVDLSGL